MQSKIYKLVSSAKQGLLAFVLTVFLSTVYSQTYTLSYTGGTQTLMIPTTGNYRIECWGADGGDVTAGPGGGGKGGYSTGEFNVTTPGIVLNILVGGKGGSASGTGSPAGAGGWNGGGGGGTIGRSGGGGGGGTDVRLGGLSASNRIIVAGGGGGAAYYSLLAAGGNGGGVIAQNGDVISSGNVVTTGGGGAGANGGSPGLSSTGYIPTNGTATGGGGGGNSPGVGVGQPGVGGGAGGAGGAGGSGSTGSSAGGGGGFAGGAGGTQTGNMGSAGGGGSGFIGGVSNGTTVALGQTGFVPNPDLIGNGKVIITRLCNISIFPSQNPMCIGNTITLTSDALSGITWFSGSNAPSINVNPTVTTTYSMVGTSTVIISTGTINCIAKSFITVTVNPLPVLSIVAFPTVACSGGTSSLTGLGASSPTSYSWSNGMNGVQTATVIPTGNTTYTLTGVNNFGCTNTQTIELVVNTNILTVNQSTTAICSGQSANITANGAVTYTWSNGLMFQTIPVTPTITTIYTVIATDLNNCSISNSLTLTVFNNPTVSITSDKTDLCKGESITLTGAGATSYSWSTNVQTPSVVYTLPSDITYYYSVIGTGANGCSSMASFSIAASKCAGINETANFNSVVGIYPNPGNGQFNISTSQVTDYLNLKVYNALGMLVKSQQILSTESKLDLVNETNGIYFVNICDQNNVIKMIKIVKQ
ncbi:T9SS type A sorting domain-containing protein [Aurantibacillus circumpalustris]|uniref:T9SS type A sorting domain-containing protein n=1 Tax=Aurantibacillus circumpalustris TaxID=3036359 RepID=UPI00295ACEE4|nr:T9SS type A sorting domain-containing protein [Aurantibacillus circumpalustris]